MLSHHKGFGFLQDFFQTRHSICGRRTTHRALHIVTHSPPLGREITLTTAHGLHHRAHVVTHVGHLVVIGQGLQGAVNVLCYVANPDRGKESSLYRGTPLRADFFVPLKWPVGETDIFSEDPSISSRLIASPSHSVTPMTCALF